MSEEIAICTFFESVASLAPLVAAVAALVGACVAWNGLDTWKRERNADFAKDLAAEIYKYRQALHGILTGYVVRSDRDFYRNSDLPDQVTDELRLNRWRWSREIRSDVERLLAEAELRWPGVAMKAFKPIDSIERELATSILRLGTLNSRQEVNDQKLRDDQIAVPKWDKSFDKQTDEVLDLGKRLQDVESDRDEMRQRINKAFDEMTHLLRKKI